MTCAHLLGKAIDFAPDLLEGGSCSLFWRESRLRGRGRGSLCGRRSSARLLLRSFLRSRSARGGRLVCREVHKWHLRLRLSLLLLVSLPLPEGFSLCHFDVGTWNTGPGRSELGSRMVCIIWQAVHVRACIGVQPWH